MSFKVLTVIILKVQKYNKPELNSEQEIENLEITLIPDNDCQETSQPGNCPAFDVRDKAEVTPQPFQIADLE